MDSRREEMIVKKLLLLISFIFVIGLVGCNISDSDIEVTMEMDTKDLPTQLPGMIVTNQKIIVPIHNDKLLQELGLSNNHCSMAGHFMDYTSLRQIKDKENHGQVTPCYMNGELFILYTQPSTLIRTYKDYNVDDKHDRFFNWGDTLTVTGTLYQGVAGLHFIEELETPNEVIRENYPCSYIIAQSITCNK